MNNANYFQLHGANDSDKVEIIKIEVVSTIEHKDAKKVKQVKKTKVESITEKLNDAASFRTKRGLVRAILS